METISAGDANRHFSSLLREVAAGKAVTILSRGKPVATSAPPGQDVQQQEAAKQQLLARLNQQGIEGARSWTRNDLYED